MEDYMPVKRCFLLLIAVCAAFPVGAATVSFMVIETGLDAEAAANQHSGLWESGLLDVFFESGHIVSNTPVLRLEGMPDEAFPPEAQDNLDEALEGGIEYFIIALLEYQNQGGKAGRPQRVTLRLFKTQPFELVFEQESVIDSARSAKEEYENLKKVARVLVPQME